MLTGTLCLHVWAIQPVLRSTSFYAMCAKLYKKVVRDDFILHLDIADPANHDAVIAPEVGQSVRQHGQHFRDVQYYSLHARQVSFTLGYEQQMAANCPMTANSLASVTSL